MEILKPGKDIRGATWYGKCNKCDAIISAKGSELGEILVNNLSANPENYVYRSCPACNSLLSVYFVEADSERGQKFYNEYKQSLISEIIKETI